MSPKKCSVHTIALATGLLLCTVTNAREKEEEKVPLWHGVMGAPWVRFKLDRSVSDEFEGNYLDENKWDNHGLRNQNTGCPTWNGATNHPRTQFSTYFTTTTEPYTNKKVPYDKRQYQVREGMLHLRLSKKHISYFENREYYCNSTNFACNFDFNRPCYGTSFNGDPILKNASDPTSYRYINHDKCKVEPFCIPHPRYVVGAPRIYQAWVAPNVVGRQSFRYGFFEANVKVARTSAVSAVWMYDHNVFPSYARYVQDGADGRVRLESPSAIRSRRWQEIDILEVMSTPEFERQYIPNVHVFSMYKGEFTRPPDAGARGGGGGGARGPLGPIVLDRTVFEVGRNPGFARNDPERANSWHLNPGSIGAVRTPWADNFHRVGLYWSATEIRFVLDGDEVLRVKNTLVHQRMFMVLSMSFNVPWAGTDPVDADAEQEFVVDYVRRWDVELDVPTPPSKLPLDYRMVTNFESMGNDFRAVDGRFPIPDDNRSVEFAFEEEIENGQRRRKGIWRKKKIPDDVVRMADIGAGGRHRKGHWKKHFGCEGHGCCGENVTGRKEKASVMYEMLLNSRMDRNREPSGRARYDPRNSVTAFEDHDANTVGAGWAA